MPRPHRSLPAGYCYHVLNRGNARQQVFHKDEDFAAFVKLFDEAHERSCPMLPKVPPIIGLFQL